MINGSVVMNVTGSRHQMAFWDSPARYRALVSGIGGGKTFAGCVEVLRQPPGSRGAIIAPTYRMLQDATLQTLLEIVRRAGVLEKFNKSDMIMHLKNGVEILLRSADDPDKLRGPNLGWAYIDEAAMVKMMVFDLMLGRLRLQPGKLWITTTPRGLNWVYKLFKESRNPDYFLAQYATRDNPFLPKHFVDSLDDRYKGQFHAQEAEGEFVEWVESPVYTSFKKARNVKSGVFGEYRPTLPLNLCCDFNAKVMVWPVIQIVGDQPYQLCEISMVGRTDVKKMVKQFKLMFPNHSGGLTLFGDASGGNSSALGEFTIWDVIMAEFQNYSCDVNLMVPKSNPRVINRVAATNEVLDGTGLWMPLLMDEDETEMTQRDFSHVEWDERGRDVKKITDSGDERSTLTHASDAFGYWAALDAPIESISVPHQVTKGRDYDRGTEWTGFDGV